MGLKKMPLKFIVAQGIRKIQSCGRADLQVYVDRLKAANDADNHEEVTKILADFSTYLIQTKGKGIKV